MTGRPHQLADKLVLAAFGSIAVAVAVLGLKLAAAWQTGSAALYSDAMESLVNVATAVMALYTVRLAQRPADLRHQFGHYKAEYFSAVAEGVLIAVAALLILQEAWSAFIRPRQFTGLIEGMALNAVATTVNAAWCAFLIVWGGRRRSPALVAGGWH